MTSLPSQSLSINSLDLFTFFLNEQLLSDEPATAIQVNGGEERRSISYIYDCDNGQS